MKKLKTCAIIIIFAILIILSGSFIITMLCGIVNHGNVIGLIVCLVVMLDIILYKLYNKNKAVRVISGIIGWFAAAAAIYSIVISVFIISGMMNTPERAVKTGTFGGSEQKTVIVLGCKANNGHPSVMLTARLNKAIEYLNQNPDDICVLTGGMGADEIEPESVSMRRYLITNGISEDRIYIEDMSRNTEQNILFTKKIIDEQKLPTDVIIVSESYHVYRGVRNAEKQGLNAAALPAFSESTVWALPSYWIREIFAVSRDYVYDFLDK